MASRTQQEQRDLVLLSLDSGRFESLSGLSQLFILREIFRLYEHDVDLEPDSVKACDVFDLIVGTGTGGLVACLIGPLQMTVAEAINAYISIHEKVFSGNDISQEERATRLENTISQMIEGQPISECKMETISRISQLSNCYVSLTAMTPTNLTAPAVFRTFRARHGAPPPSTLLEALSATLSHPETFPPVSLGQPPVNFISASFGFCNPLDTLVDEVKSNFRSRTISTIVSIGAGRSKHVSLSDLSDFDKAAGEQMQHCQRTSEQWHKVFSNNPGLYFRLDADGFETAEGLTYEAIYSHSMTYLNRGEVIALLDDIGDRITDRTTLRDSVIKVSEISRPNPGVVDKISEGVKNLHVEVMRIPQRSSVNSLPYADRASFNISLTCCPGTREEILQQIRSWRDSRRSSSALLRLEAAFGLGKSTVAHTIAHEAKKQGTLVSAFFVTLGTTEKPTLGSSEHHGSASIHNLVGTFLRDLAGICEPFHDAIGAKIEQEPQLRCASAVIQFEELFIPFAFLLPPNEQRIWIIDGYDELLRQNLSDSVAFFECLISSLPNLPPHFTVFITSRPFKDARLQKSSNSDCVTTLRLDPTSPFNGEDMNRLADRELQRVEEENPDFKCSELSKQQISEFRQSAGVLPLWLKIVGNLLINSTDPHRALNDLLSREENPATSLALRSRDYQSGIDEVYAHVISSCLDLSQDDNRKHLHCVVQVLLGLQRPLSQLTLEELFGSSKLSATDSSSELSVTALRIVLRSLRPLLVGENEEPVEFLHMSFRDFLAQSRAFGKLVQIIPSPRNLDLGHNLLLNQCLYILQTQLTQDIAGLGFLKEIPGDRVIPSPPNISSSLQYSSNFWCMHLLETQHSSQVPKLLQPFMENTLDSWLELEAMLGNFSFTFEVAVRIQSLIPDVFVDVMDKKLQLSLKRLSIYFENSRRFEEACLTREHIVSRMRPHETDLELIRSGPNPAYDLKSPSEIYSLSEALCLLSLSYDRLQHREKAHMAVEESILLVGQLIADDLPAKGWHELYCSQLAASLTLKSRYFSQLDKSTALVAVQNAVNFLRLIIDEKSSPKRIVRLAAALEMLSQSLANMGRHSEALDAIEEAVELRRQLSSKHPDVADYQRNLATTLKYLSDRFSKLGKDAEALIPIREAIIIRRQLIHGPCSNEDNQALASTLCVFSQRLTQTGIDADAFKAVEEAVILQRPLATKNPELFRAELASCLLLFSKQCYLFNREAEALDAFQEAVQLGHHAGPSFLVNCDRLAQELSKLSIDLKAHGKHRGALKAIQEAVILQRQLTAKGLTVPSLNGPITAAASEEVLVTFLYRLAYHLSEFGQYDEALYEIDEALRRLREGAYKDPKLAMRVMSAALKNRSNRLTDLGRHDEALEEIEEARKMRHKADNESAADFNRELADLLGVQSDCLSKVAGRLPEALMCAEEAVILHYKALEDQPDEAWERDLARLLNSKSAHLAELGEMREASRAVLEALPVCRNIVKKQPQRNSDLLAHCLHIHARCLGGVGDFEEALKAAEEAATLYRSLITERPLKFRADLDEVESLRQTLEMLVTVDSQTSEQSS